MTEREVEELILLKGKVEKLLGNYAGMRKQLEEERSKRKEVEGLLDEKEKDYNKLEKKYSKLQLSGAIKGDEESTRVARKRINNLVREIDNCIALLNNI
ncbi:MAG TPA: hypothetical protein VJ877_04775 [Bacteroidales bacterium]|nr:hypothetical protein [Bacteroidales bacterium]